MLHQFSFKQLLLSFVFILTACDSTFKPVGGSVGQNSVNTSNPSSSGGDPSSSNPPSTPAPAPAPAPTTPALVCPANEHKEGNVCVANIKACTIANGVGEQVWNGTAFGACTLKSCNAGYQVTSGACSKSLIGRWTSPCFTVGSNDIIVTNNFIDDTKHELIQNNFYNPDAPGTCRSPSHEIRATNTYKRAVSLTVPGAVEVDFTRVQVVFTVVNEETVSSFNSSNFCGKTNWALRVPTPFGVGADPVCAGSPLIRNLNAVEGLRLRLGDYKGSTDVSIRPTSLSSDPSKIHASSRVCAPPNGQGEQSTDINGVFGACKPLNCNPGLASDGASCTSLVVISKPNFVNNGKIYYGFNDAAAPTRLADFCRFFTGVSGMNLSTGTAVNQAVQNVYASCSTTTNCKVGDFGKVLIYDLTAVGNLSIYTSLTCRK